MVIPKREDGHVLGRALDFEVGGYIKKGKPKRTWKRPFEEESVKIGLRRGNALECWRKSDFCWVEVNLTTLTCWGHYQI